jgi:hypothetical protein
LAVDGPRHVYLFRSEHFAHGSSTVICAAPVDLVVTAYGGGGHRDQEGVQRAFGGSAFYRNEETGACFLGVWGARNASRFRSALRRNAEIEIIREPPPARLAWWNTGGLRPPISAQHGID